MTWGKVVPLGCSLLAKCGRVPVCPEVCALHGYDRFANLRVPYEPRLTLEITLVDGLLFAMYRLCPRVLWASMYLVNKLKMTGERGLHLCMVRPNGVVLVVWPQVRHAQASGASCWYESLGLWSPFEGGACSGVSSSGKTKELYFIIASTAKVRLV